MIKWRSISDRKGMKIGSRVLLYCPYSALLFRGDPIIICEVKNAGDKDNPYPWIDSGLEPTHWRAMVKPPKI